MRPSRIPLFPLEVVVFPSTPLPLHIFEPRYRRMVKQCLEAGSEFGVVLAQANGIARIGCTAEITEVVKRYDDGRMDILAIGRLPFRIQQVYTDDPLLEGDVEYLEDEPSPISRDTQRELLALFEKCYALVHSEPPASLDLGNINSLAFHIAHALPLDLRAKQTILEIRAEQERQERLLAFLKDWLPQRERAVQLRSRASGNGHGLAF